MSLKMVKRKHFLISCIRSNRLCAMDIDMDDFKEKKKTWYLLTKVHQKNFSGRVVVSQVNDLMYKVCKNLTDILHLLARS